MSGVELTPTQLSTVKELYLNGRYRSALEAGAEFGPVRHWQGPWGRLMGGRLAMQLGATNLGRQLHLLARRQYPANLEVLYYHARHRAERFGPLAAWRFLQQHTDWSDAHPDLRADWLGLTGFILARLRDFDRADRYLNQAEAIAPNRPWLAIERAGVLEAQERYDDAMMAARRSQELQPWFRPGVQAIGHLLVKLHRQDEAIEFLTEAVEKMESSQVVAQLVANLLDCRKPDVVHARKLLEKYEELTPLAEKDVLKWLNARRTDVSYHMGDFAQARVHALAVDDEFYTAMATRLATPGNGPHHFAIPIKTLADSKVVDLHEALKVYWGVPQYPSAGVDFTTSNDGLPDPQERAKLEQAGWATAEFTLTETAAETLLSQGIPFLVTVVEVGISQSRLAIGFDKLRGTLTLIDGVEAQAIEAPINVLMTRYASSGPRALVALPPGDDRVPLIKDLPDQPAFEALFAISRALLANDRSLAGTAAYSLYTQFAGHRVARQAAIMLARADGNPVLTLNAAEKQLEAFTSDPTAVVLKAAALRDLGRTTERFALLKCEGMKPEADALIVQSLAQMLLADFRTQDDAERLLRRSVRVRPSAAAGYYLLASQHWESQRFHIAADLYRFAACQDDREDQFADAYFRVARTIGQTPEAVRLFQQKATRASTPNPAAARALFNALLDREEPTQAFAAIDKAVDRSAGTATEGELRLFRAEVQANRGRFDLAEADLASTRSLVPPGTWYRAAARIARIRPDLAGALAHLQSQLAIEPYWADGHRLVVGILMETQGKAAVKNYLEAECLRHPHFYPLLRLRIELMGSDPAAEHALRNLLTLAPGDAWAHRQLALLTSDHGNDAGATLSLAEAAKHEPDHPSHFAVTAHVHRKAGRNDDAISTYKQGLKIHPDFELAIGEMVELSRGRKEKFAALRYVAEILHTSPHTGDGLVAYRDHYLGLAKDGEDHERLYRELQKFLDERPDLWQCWSLNIQQLGIMHRLDEANSLAIEATERFPLLAKLWVDRAEVCRVMDRSEDQIEALKKAVAAAPGWAPASRELSEALSVAEESDEAVAVLDRAVARNPLDPLAHGFLAEALWNAGRSGEALERVKVACRHEPGYDWAWASLSDWSERLDQPEEALCLARELAQERPGDPRVWLRLARFLAGNREQAVEALHALDQATNLDPGSVEAHDLQAEILAELGRFDDALLAAKPKQLADDMPLVLQGRAAWVEARRGNYSAAIAPMQALVSVNPDYYWGWQQLADWYNDTGRVANFLEASGELVRLRPDHPVPLALRGEAKIKTGDREGGKQDLREALRINARYAPAAAILFDACLDDEELREAHTALAVLQEHLTGPEVAVKQLQLHAKTADEEGAVAAFTEICQHDGETTAGVVKVAFDAMVDNGYEDAAVRVLKTAWQAGPPFNPWASVFWVDSTTGAAAPVADRLSAVEAAVTGYPSFSVAYDRKAELLVALKQYDAAKSACSSPALGQPPPIPLRGRAAWVEAERGDLPAAIGRMKAVLAEDPNYAWGWRQLAGWAEALGRSKDQLEAAEQLVRLNPDDALSLVFRGEARKEIGDRVGAREDFRRAFDIDPTFDLAGIHLIAEQLAANDPGGAADTLRQLQEHNRGPLVRLRAVQVACAVRDARTARAELRALAGAVDTSAAVLREAVEAMDNENWTLEADDVLAARAAEDDTPIAVATLWAEREIAGGRADRVAENLPALLKNSPEAARATVQTLAWGYTQTQRATDAAAVLQKYKDLLRSDDTSWAKAGATLAQGKLYAQAAAWLSDYTSRPDTESWVLRALADSLRMLDRDADALAVCAEGIKRNTPPDVSMEFRAWLSLDWALKGDLGLAEMMLDSIDTVGLPDGVKLLVALPTATLMVAKAGPTAKANAFTEAKATVLAAAVACPANDLPPGTGRWYLRTVEELAKQAGTMKAKLWAVWQRVRPAVK